ncbi:MAG: M23 family metallopeptidase [Myxococcota bacterium]|nr:M23 family metallopeptidase [Myxococcota bacterium]MDW8363146.1 M23 family metallopeptidase [Myxococcales bacterium]
MPIRLASWWLCALAALLGAPSAVAQVRVDLAALVPARWLDGAVDHLPLEPARQRRRLPPRCRTRGGYREHCSGPRRVPSPHGPAAELAGRLALGQRATAMWLLHEAPLREWVEAARGTDPDPSLRMPVDGGRVGRGFGRTRRGALRHRPHRGVDIAAAEGTPVRAARGGLVAYADNGLTGYGNALIVVHEDGASTLYAHCRALYVFAGQRVARGDVIADVGRTGFAPAPHLHFEWRVAGRERNPVLGWTAANAQARGARRENPSRPS